MSKPLLAFWKELTALRRPSGVDIDTLQIVGRNERKQQQQSSAEREVMQKFNNNAIYLGINNRR
jgi:hypothetical protein